MLLLPTHVQLEVTDKCNLRCRHCYRLDTDQIPESKDLDDEGINRLVQQIIDAKVYSLVITGGEPLIRPEVVINAVKRAREVGMFVSVNTNLLLLTPEIAASLKKSDVSSLLVSCPSSNTDVYKQVTRCGDYNRLLPKLKLLMDFGISCMVNMVVTPTNCNFIRSTAADMAQLGIKRFAATPASLNVEYPNNKELLSAQQTLDLLEDLRWCSDNLGLHVDILEPMPKCFFPKWCWEKDYAFTKRVCQAGRMSVSISNSGEVRPCSHNPISYGNLFQRTMEEIWSDMSSYRDNSVPNICKSCPSVTSCNGACRTNSLATLSSLNKPDRLMTGHIESTVKKQKQLFFNNDVIIHFKGKLRWRKEGEYYSISSKISGSNIVIVNKAMFDFVVWLNDVSSLSVDDLLKNSDKNSSQVAINRVLNFLLNREFIYIN